MQIIIHGQCRSCILEKENERGGGGGGDSPSIYKIHAGTCPYVFVCNIGGGGGGGGGFPLQLQNTCRHLSICFGVQHRGGGGGDSPSIYKIYAGTCPYVLVCNIGYIQ